MCFALNILAFAIYLADQFFLLSETWGSFTCTLVSPLVTIKYHNFYKNAIRNTVQSKQFVIV